jgi:hypothetical protein
MTRRSNEARLPKLARRRLYFPLQTKRWYLPQGTRVSPGAALLVTGRRLACLDASQMLPRGIEEHSKLSICAHPPVCLPHARARERVVPISELVFGTLTKTGVVLRRLLDLPRLPARRALRTAVPLLLILRTGGGTGTTFTSGLMRLSQTVVPWPSNRYRCSGTCGGRTIQGRGVACCIRQPLWRSASRS